MGGTDKILVIWENGGGYIGVERRAEGEPFENYDLERYGYKYATSIAPMLNLSAEPEIGARVAVPVECIK